MSIFLNILHHFNFCTLPFPPSHTILVCKLCERMYTWHHTTCLSLLRFLHINWGCFFISSTNYRFIKPIRHVWTSILAEYHFQTLINFYLGSPLTDNNSNYFHFTYTILYSIKNINMTKTIWLLYCIQEFNFSTNCSYWFLDQYGNWLPLYHHR